MPDTHISALILAAGESTRMGRLKQLLPWDGTTLIDWQARQMLEAGVDDVVIVLGHEAAAIGTALAQTSVRVVVNEEYGQGRASSVRRGADALRPETSAVIILSVDQPRPAWIARRLIDVWRRSPSPLLIPTVGGRRGHPLILDGALVNELRAVTEETLGLRAITDRHRDQTVFVPIETPVVRFDLNTPADFDAATASLAGGEWSER